ncbi:hypothetical protein BH24DEI2_BH24DEI2_02770 [soil metagenome]
MRTTLTLDDDVSVMLKKLQEAEGVGFKEAVNRALRQGLYQLERPVQRTPYTVTSLDLGKSFLSLDDVGEVLAVAEGEDYL